MSLSPTVYRLHTFEIDWKNPPGAETHFVVTLSFFRDRVGFVLNRNRGTFELPGGLVEPWDASWEAASVREYEEEVGVAPKRGMDYAFSVENIDASGKKSSYCHVFLHEADAPEGNLHYFRSVPDNASFPREIYERIILSGRLIREAVGDTWRSWDALSPEYSDFGSFSDSEIHYGPCIFGEKTLRIIGDVEWKKILDVGCGLGHNALILAKNGGGVIGIDRSHRQIEQAQELAEKESVQVDFRVLNMEDIAVFDAESFDIVCSIFALQFAESMETFLQNAYKILAPGWKLVFSLPNPIPEFPPSEKSMVMMKDWNGTSKMGMRYFNPEHLECLLQKSWFVELEFHRPKYVRERELTPYHSDYYRKKLEATDHPYTLIVQAEKPYGY